MISITISILLGRNPICTRIKGGLPVRYRYSIISVWIMLVCTVMALSGCGRYHYTEEDRSAFESISKEKMSIREQTISYTKYPEDLLEYISLKADLIVQATIKSDGTTGCCPMFDDIEDGPTFICTRYDVIVDELWFGPSDAPVRNDHFILELYGDEEYGAMKVHQGDKVVLFLQKVEDENLYYPTASSNGTFVLNPPTNTIFALSPLDRVTAFDGASAEAFKVAVKEKLQNYQINGTAEKLAPGKAGELFAPQS